MTRKEWWIEQFENLSTEDKVALFNEYASENRSDDMIYDFDDDFFETFYEGKAIDAVRAWHFGGKPKDDGHLADNCWSDEYITFNGYANLETMSSFEADDHCNLYAEEIYEFDNYDSYIDITDFDDELEKRFDNFMKANEYEEEVSFAFQETYGFDEFDSEEDMLDAFGVWVSQYIKDNDIETNFSGVDTDEIQVEDREVFGDWEEHGLVMEFDDGHAENDCYEMSYPRLSELTDVQKIEIYLYTDRNEIVPFDVALKFGKLEEK